MPLVSVIITTKNEAANIKNCLVSIKNQTYKNVEIIVVDNFSSDTTVKISKRYTHAVFVKGPERSAQRNFGIKKAKGKYFMYVDADMSLSKNLIAEAVSKMESDSSVGGLYIPLRWVGKNWIIRAKGFEREFYDSTRLDAVRFIRKSIIISTGGFDDRLYAGEDWDLDKRIRQISSVKSIKAIMYHHEDESINLKDYLKKLIYYSGNMNVYINKWGKNDIDVKKQVSPFYRMFWVFVENGKWRKLLNHPDLALLMVFLKIITGLVYISSKINK